MWVAGREAEAGVGDWGTGSGETDRKWQRHRVREKKKFLGSLTGFLASFFHDNKEFIE